MLRRFWYYLVPPAYLLFILWFQPAERPVGMAQVQGYPLYGVATRWVTDDCDTLAYALRAENAARGGKAGLVGPVWFNKKTGFAAPDGMPRQPEQEARDGPERSLDPDKYELRTAPYEPRGGYMAKDFEPQLKLPPQTRERYFLEYPPLALWLFRVGLVGAPGENADVHPLLLHGHQFYIGCHAPATDGERALYARYRHALRIYAVLMVLAQLGLMLLLDFAFARGPNPIPTWLLVLPGFLYFTPCRFDILPAVLVMAGVICADRKGGRMAALSGLLFGLAVALKMYPLVLAPILLRYVATDWKRFVLWCVCGAVPVVGSYGAMYATDGVEGATVPLRFQLGRNPEPEWCFYGDVVSEDPPETAGEPGWHLTGKLLPTELAYKNTEATLLRTLPVLVVALLGSIRRPPDVYSLLRRSTLAVLAFLTLSVFYSPQWWQWLAVMLVPLAARHRWLIGLIVANDLWTFLHFPIIFDIWMFGGWGDSAGWVINLHVLIRALLWLWLAVALVVAEVRGLRSPSPSGERG